MQNHWPQSRHVLAPLTYPGGSCDDVISVRDALRAHCERLCHLALNGRTVRANVSVIWPLHDQCICICVSVRCCCLTVRVLVPHFLPWAGVASARLTQRQMSWGEGFASCEPFALFIRFLLGIHKLRPSATHRAPSASEVVRWQPR